MKEIFTSNYAKSGTYHLSYAISVKPPEWYKGKHFKLLAPTWDLVINYKKQNITKEQYSNLYIELLLKRNITAEYIIETLPNGARLLCYESPGDFCHRRVLAKWIEKQTGFIIPEFTSDEQIQKQKIIQDIFDF